jgi:hypothetical protein
MDGITRRDELDGPSPVGGVDSPEQVRTLISSWLGEDTGGIEQVCADGLRQRALLLDLPRLTEQVLARVALGMRDQESLAPEPTFVHVCLSRAIEDLLRQDYERVEGDSEEEAEGCGRCALLVEGMGLELEYAQDRAVAFNSLPTRARRAFFAIALDNIEFMDLVGTDRWTDEELREGVLVSLEALLGRKRTHGGEQ